MIDKEKFIYIMNQLQETKRVENEVNRIYKSSSNITISNFNSSTISANDSIVIDLLNTMLNIEDELLEWWIYELDFGRKWTKNSLRDKNDKSINVKTAEKLYDYITKER
jgi:hypothetical protein